ncbi:MAG: helix-turn-helix domain-containing protein [Pseudomonadota bacterium]
MVSFVTTRPLPIIKDHVLELWLLRDDGAPRIGLPKPYVEIVISLAGTHFWKPTADGPESEYRTAWVTPVQEGPRHARAIGERVLIGARLYPWVAHGWLGAIPPGDGTPPPHLSEFIGDDAQHLREWLLDAPSESALFQRFGTWLGACLEAVDPDTSRLRELADEAPPSVEALARSLNVSGPTLRRSFASKNGLSPKRWLILHRIDRILRDPRLSDPTSSLAELAAEYGYADQAHLTREMIRFAGTAPSGMRKRDPSYPPHMRGED